MLFSSAIFLFLFLPVLLCCYYLAPKKAKNTILLLASLSFYAFGEKVLILLLIASIIIDYFAAIIIEKGHKKQGLFMSIVANIGILFYFKYGLFFIESSTYFIENFGFDKENITSFFTVALPLGVSFFTFQTMSYTIDVYFGRVKASRNIIDFGTYVSMFPQLVAGPIVRYIDIQKQLKSRKVTIQKFSEGIERFIIGLSKKVLIANNLAFLADGAFMVPTAELSTIFAWLGIIAYTFQIYFDFSGYSDMAIGLAKMFGFDLPENFNHPYNAKSIREFWQKWHISLSTWFRDYVYIPLGGNRKGKTRTYFNLGLVFLITGLWHGASFNFIFWGCIHGFFIILEKVGLSKTLEKSNRFISRFYTLFVVIISWVFFRADTMSLAIDYLKKMLSLSVGIDNGFFTFFLREEVFVAFVFAIIFSVNTYAKLTEKYKNYRFFMHIKYAGLIALFMASIIYISVDSYNPFIYYRF